MSTQDIHRPDGLSSVRQSAEAVVREIDAAEATVRHDAKPGSGISISKTLSYNSAIRAIKAQAEAEESFTVVEHLCTNKYFCSAAIALQAILADQYGVSFASPTPGFFGDTPPRQLTVPLSPTETTTIVLGDFIVNDMKVRTRVVNTPHGVTCLKVEITTTNGNRDAAMRLITQLDAAPDVYAGQCLVFDGDESPRIPRLVEPMLTEEDIALNPNEEAALRMFLTQIRHHQKLKAVGIPFKRGVLMYGPWGTGKTLGAAVAMNACRKAGITVIHERSWDRLLSTMYLARDMQPAMVFCEDIDRASNRTLTNMLDDANLKHCEVSLVVTTNHPEKLDPALTRTGRLDICIPYALPEAETRAHILAINDAPYFTDAIADATEKMTGSDLAEIAKRARINAIAAERELCADDILGAAISMHRPPAYVAPDVLSDHIRGLADALGITDIASTCNNISHTVDNIESNQ